ncbi:polysaccharide deacetylase family protein [Chloroflexota bacterium]
MHPEEGTWAVQPIRPQNFDQQINYLCHNYEIISLEDLARYAGERKALHGRIAVITFDDGYRDNYLYAYPILKKYKVTATIFLTSGHIGTGSLFWWDKIHYALHNTPLRTIELKEFGSYSLASYTDRVKVSADISSKLIKLPETEKIRLTERLMALSLVTPPTHLAKELLLSWDEVKEMKEGSITFGAHTVNHPILTRLPLEHAKNEILQSKKDIEKHIGQTVTAFAYPNGALGDFDCEHVRFLKDNGFICAVTTIPRLVTSSASPYEMGRVQPGPNLATFRFMLSGLYMDAKSLARR